MHVDPCTILTEFKIPYFFQNVCRTRRFGGISMRVAVRKVASIEVVSEIGIGIALIAKHGVGSNRGNAIAI